MPDFSFLMTKASREVMATLMSWSALRAWITEIA
jgi:hypothetical protein